LKKAVSLEQNLKFLQACVYTGLRRRGGGGGGKKTAVVVLTRKIGPGIR